MNSADPLVSVVTPVYNGEKYLRQCIESVLNQTYANWEYIIVNNRSTDRSLEIAQSYAVNDSRIRIHNNHEFVDVIQNHNIAFQKISTQSKYCKVVHADDWLFPECIAQMTLAAETAPTAGMVGSYSLCNSRVKCDRLPYPSHIVSGRELCRRTLLGELYVFLSPSSLMIRSDLIRSRNPFFEGTHTYADVEAYYDLLQHCDFGFVHQVLTYVRMHEESVTSSRALRLNSLLLADVHFLTKYGPVYMAPDEHRRRLKELTDEYYRFLVTSVFQLRDKKFWDYHRVQLERMGSPLNRTKLAWLVCLRLFDGLLNPKQSAESLFGRVRCLMTGRLGYN